MLSSTSKLISNRAINDYIRGIENSINYFWDILINEEGSSYELLSTLKRSNPNLICSDKKMVYYIIIYHLGLIVVVIIVIMNSNIEFIKIINIILLMFIPLQIKLKVEFGYSWFNDWIIFVVYFVLLFLR